MKTVVAAAESSLVGITPKEQLTEKTVHLAKTVASLLDEADHVVLCPGGRAEAELIHNVLADGAKAGISPDPPTDSSIAMSIGFLGFNLEDAVTEQIAAMGKSDALPTCAMLTQVIPNDTDLPQIIELDAIRTLLNSCRFLIAGGSGGVPVHRTKDDVFEGTGSPADLSLTAAAIAAGTGADCLLILMDDNEELPQGPMSAEQAKSASGLDQLSASTRSALHAASVYVASAAGRQAVLAHVSNAHDALQGKTGLQIR